MSWADNSFSSVHLIARANDDDDGLSVVFHFFLIKFDPHLNRRLAPANRLCLRKRFWTFFGGEVEIIDCERLRH